MIISKTDLKNIPSLKPIPLWLLDAYFIKRNLVEYDIPDDYLKAFDSKEFTSLWSTEALHKHGFEKIWIFLLSQHASDEVLQEFLNRDDMPPFYKPSK